MQTPTAGAYGALAWVLATCPDGSLRRGKKTLECVKPSCDRTKAKDPAKFDGLAAACARIGNVIDAAPWKKNALPLPDDDQDAGEQWLKLDREQEAVRKDGSIG